MNPSAISVAQNNNPELSSSNLDAETKPVWARRKSASKRGKGAALQQQRVNDRNALFIPGLFSW